MSKLPVFRLPVALEPSAPAITPTFEDCLGTFTIDIPASNSPIESPIVQLAAPSPAAPKVETINPATSKRHGSITYDRENRRPTHEWNSLEEFHAWRINEELEHGIELLLSSKRPSADGPLRHENLTYSCSRQGTGGETKYVRKCTDSRKRPPSKRTGCRCKVNIKTYHHVSTVLGWYAPEHDHAIGVANLMYTRLRDSTRGHVLNLLRMNMSPKEVFTRVRDAHGRHERGHYITMQDIYRLRKIVKQEEAARSTSSVTDGDQPDYERSEASPIKKEEESTIQPEDASETGSTTEVDEDLDVLDEQSEESASPHLYTAAASMEFAASSVVPATSMESSALPIVPATQTTHYMAPPPPSPVPPSHNMPGQWFMPPPVVITLAHPPYQMTLYPLYPVYLPSPTR